MEIDSLKTSEKLRKIMAKKTGQKIELWGPKFLKIITVTQQIPRNMKKENLFWQFLCTTVRQPYTKQRWSKGFENLWENAISVKK